MLGSGPRKRQEVRERDRREFGRSHNISVDVLRRADRSAVHLPTLQYFRGDVTGPLEQRPTENGERIRSTSGAASNIVGSRARRRRVLQRHALSIGATATRLMT